mmetsp:Transcript_40070/g.127539  ORF Transcript_40070/g.127539 Transcript_40070/m.127539 type:complete len:225 (+) Transcript_40070:637-1311(+)
MGPPQLRAARRLQRLFQLARTGPVLHGRGSSGDVERVPLAELLPPQRLLRAAQALQPLPGLLDLGVTGAEPGAGALRRLRQGLQLPVAVLPRGGRRRAPEALDGRLPRRPGRQRPCRRLWPHLRLRVAAAERPRGPGLRLAERGGGRDREARRRRHGGAGREGRGAAPAGARLPLQALGRAGHLLRPPGPVRWLRRPRRRLRPLQRLPLQGEPLQWVGQQASRP